MSFYLENSANTNSNSLSHSSNHGFTCQSCGNTTYYEDSFGGICCSECFTQSQTFTQTINENDGEFNADGEVIANTALMSYRKTRIKKATKKYNYKKRTLPTLDECITSYQIIIQIFAKRVIELIGLDEEGGKILMSNCKDVWFGYLTSFREGALHYGGKGKRICLRDSFFGKASCKRLPDLYKSLEGKELHSKRKFKSEHEQNDDDDDDGIPKGADKVEEEDFIRHFRHPNIVKSFQIGKESYIVNSKNEETLHSKEAALYLQLGMDLVLCILNIGLQRIRAGIAMSQLMNWCQSHKLPYFKAWYQLPNHLRQSSLRYCKHFYIPSTLPRINILYQKLNLLYIASSDDGIPKTMHGIMDNAPLMAARFIHDLGLINESTSDDSNLLDDVLALMGIKPSNSIIPIERCFFTNLTTPKHIMAVIIITIKMTIPNWNETMQIIFQDDNFYPWKESQFTHLRYNSNIRNYLLSVYQNEFQYLPLIDERLNGTIVSQFESNNKFQAPSSSLNVKEEGQNENNNEFEYNNVIAGKHTKKTKSNKKRKYTSYSTPSKEGNFEADYPSEYRLLVEFCSSYIFENPSSLHNIICYMEEELVDLVHYMKRKNKK